MREKILAYFHGDFRPFYEKYLPEIKRIGGSEFMAICPFHNDENPSLNFNSATGSFFCHGCGKKSGIFHFYSKINGLDTRRDFRKILKGICTDFGIGWQQQKPRIVKIYDYTDANGKLIFQVKLYTILVF